MTVKDLPQVGDYVSIKMRSGWCQLCLVHEGPYWGTHYYTLLALPSQFASRATRLWNISAHWMQFEQLSDWQWLPPNDLDSGFWVPKGAQQLQPGEVLSSDMDSRFFYYRGLQDT